MKDHLVIISSVCTAEKQAQEDQQNLSGMIKSNYNLRNRVHSLYNQDKKGNYRRYQVKSGCLLAFTSSFYDNIYLGYKRSLEEKNKMP